MKIIAESAFNHNGNMEYLKELALAAKSAKADYFTVQVMSPKLFCTPDYSKRKIYIENSFSFDQWRDFFTFVSKNEVKVIPCVLDEDSMRLVYECGYRFIKLHSTDITNISMLQFVASFSDCEILLETQCSTYQDIAVAMSIIGKQVKVIFHGYSNYPTEVEDQNLNAIDSLCRDFPSCEFGFADHTQTLREIPLMAMAKGYTFLEKHITLTRNNRNFDWQVSLYPEEFLQMCSIVHYYFGAFGNGAKHPCKNELIYRDIIYKKDLGNGIFRRSESGTDYLTKLIDHFSVYDVGIALIARLKSQRLKKKVLKKFCQKSIIEDLFDRLKNTRNVKIVKLVTSYLEEDRELYDLFYEEDRFAGHPISVLDRMLSFAIENKLGAIFRVTGDNPFTDPYLVDRMVEMMQHDKLDYVRVNNVPFGVSAELFSTKYLWNLYLNMDNPNNSEYLSWFVLNDKEARKGVLNFRPNDTRVSLVNLSVDYPEDYIRVEKLLSKIGKPVATEITLGDIIANLDLEDIMDENKIVKLPEGTYIFFKDYLRLMNGVDYITKYDINETDIYNW